MESCSEPASSMETGALGVFHIKRLWSKNLIKLSDPIRRWPDEHALDVATIFALGLALEETFQYLALYRPTFEQFENWILQNNNGGIDQRRISRLNSVVNGSTYESEVQKWIDEIEASEPVLSRDDLLFWEENGYVVLHDAVPKENCQAAEQAIWQHLQMDPNNSDTWYQSKSSVRHGIMVQFFHHDALQSNRDSRRIHKAFAQLWGTSDLWTTVDRVSFNPPERKDWRFPGPFLHWDTLLKPPVEFGTQGILYLTDTAAEQGAFSCVPGFHRRIDDWLRTLPAGADPQRQDLESLGSIPIAGRAGDLIIWQNALPHGSSPNRTSRPRIAQYVKMLLLRGPGSAGVSRACL